MMKKHNSTDLLLLHLVALMLVIILITHIGITPWLSIFFSLLITILFCLQLRRLLIRPYQHLKEMLDNVISSESGLAVEPGNLHEYEEIVAAIQRMLNRLQANLEHLAGHREELRLIANSIEEIVWTQRLDGSIEWMNQLFHTVFRTTEKDRGKPYWEVINEPAVLSFMRAFIEEETPRMLEINTGEHYFLITGSLNKDADRIVFIMQNIDLIRQTEKMKKDFMVNVAHELRTPLTAIKGFSHALEENADPQSSRYIRIIQRHTDRMINMISDFQILAKLERMPELDYQLINLDTFFQNILAMYQQQLEEHKLTITTCLDPGLPKLTVDPFKFEQIFINLIDNAIQHTQEGGITINSHADGRNMIFEVSDTGTGIEKEHLSRVFERFYVADSARNKAFSGSGLGLAIVKHTVLLHRGNITVDSVVGHGTTFTITIPLNPGSES